MTATNEEEKARLKEFRAALEKNLSAQKVREAKRFRDYFYEPDEIQKSLRGVVQAIQKGDLKAVKLVLESDVIDPFWFRLSIASEAELSAIQVALLAKKPEIAAYLRDLIHADELISFQEANP